jgi:GalNAc-alpha-(1->4)-GalNAc-alpha-(1->3)-diNAcBac-PP-undecaprenol alpha-1,4-N-acetyl-D-galactosaminyltransferase
MKITFIINGFSDGGAEKVASLLCSSWSKTNSVSVIFTSKKTLSENYEVDKKVSLFWLPSSATKSPFKKIRNIKRILRQLKPDVVVSFLDPANFYAAKACKGLGCVYVTSERNDPKEEPKNLILRTLRFIAYNRATAIVFQTNEARQYFGKRIQEKGIIIPNPVKRCLINRSPADKIEKTILAIGRLEQQKNYDLMLRGFSKSSAVSKGFKLYIYGKGSLKNDIEKEIGSLNLSDSVVLCGFHSNVQQALSTSTCMILSSNFEGIPNGLLEASAMGLPWISTDCPVGGPAQISNELGTGLLFPVGSVDGLSKRIDEMINNYEREYCLAIKARNLCESNFDVSKIASRWLDLFEELINGNKAQC